MANAERAAKRRIMRSFEAVMGPGHRGIRSAKGNAKSRGEGVDSREVIAYLKRH